MILQQCTKNYNHMFCCRVMTRGTKTGHLGQFFKFYPSDESNNLSFEKTKKFA